MMKEAIEQFLNENVPGYFKTEILGGKYEDNEGGYIQVFIEAGAVIEMDKLKEVVNDNFIKREVYLDSSCVVKAIDESEDGWGDCYCLLIDIYW